MAPSSFCERREALGQLADMAGSWPRWELALIKLGSAWEARELKDLHWAWDQELEGGACDPSAWVL